MSSRILSTIFIALGFSALIAVSPSTAKAHDFEPERELFVQVFPEHVDILIIYAEAPGERTDLFRAHFGFALGGEFGEALRELSKRAIVPRMLDGLEFEVHGENPRTGEPQIEFRDHDTRLMVAAYVRYELDELADDQRRTMIVRAQDRSFLPTPTIVYGGDGLQIVDESTDAAPQTNTFQLYRGKEVETVFEQPATP